MERILKISLFSAICMFLSVSITFAATNGSTLVNTYNLDLGPDIRYLNYREPDYDIDITGLMYGVSGKFTYHGISNRDNYLMLGLDTQVLGGGLEYDGQTQSGTPLDESSDDWLIETRALIGSEYFFGDDNILTLFTGIGYRYWNNEVSGNAGYESEVQYWYAPIGIKTLGHLYKNWTAGMNAEFDFFLGGKVKSHLSDVNPDFNDPVVDQNTANGYGLGFSLHFTRDFERRNQSLRLKPYIRYWEIKESEKGKLRANGNSVQFLEPENETISGGMRVSISF